MREQIAAAGRAEVLAKHTYGHRMERLLWRRSRRWHGSWSSPTVLPLSHTQVPAGTRSASAAGPVAVRARRYDPFYFGHARPEVLALVPERRGGSWTSAAERAGWARR